MITVLGEALVDIVTSSKGTESHAGGSPFNVAVGLGRLDCPVRFIGRWGSDAHGALIDAALADARVEPVLAPTEEPTSTATATIGPTGAADYEFDIRWSLPDLSRFLPEDDDAALVHTGSIATVLPPGKDEVLRFVEAARPAATISFDPNVRPSLTADRDAARRDVERYVALADIVKASDEDLEWLYPGVDPLESARRWAEGAPAVVVVTRGEKGPWAVCAAGETSVPAPRVKVADTVGAGDSFMSGLLCAVRDAGLAGPGRRGDLNGIGTQELETLLAFAARCAAITVGRSGARPPSRAELA
ncbi:carbohydrate kinase [Falsarthrobacter nasiphocae]|uniref:Fructokinase n=1 Tax=Falsarthrobacter nasiphocae TaxID=189863 RepID=A0AAE3YFE2_9MICC|nr:carbohydrate kinase [Falsarthrobacter nasiphocae]MDR6891207.1 fructokinase [Falsarthrobacter nasiphocae]